MTRKVGLKASGRREPAGSAFTGGLTPAPLACRQNQGVPAGIGTRRPGSLGASGEGTGAGASGGGGVVWATVGVKPDTGGGTGSPGVAAGSSRLISSRMRALTVSSPLKPTRTPTRVTARRRGPELGTTSRWTRTVYSSAVFVWRRAEPVSAVSRSMVKLLVRQRRANRRERFGQGGAVIAVEQAIVVGIAGTAGDSACPGYPGQAAMQPVWTRAKGPRRASKRFVLCLSCPVSVSVPT